MIDQETDLPGAGRTARLSDAGKTIATIIATTRREWMSQGRTSPAPDESAANRARLAHPLIRFSLDPKRNSSWRARADAQARIQEVERTVDLDCTPSNSARVVSE